MVASLERSELLWESRLQEAHAQVQVVEQAHAFAEGRSMEVSVLRSEMEKARTEMKMLAEQNKELKLQATPPSI